MNPCEDFENRLNIVLDQRIDPRHDPRLNQHATDCSSCARLQQAYAHMLLLPMHEQAYGPKHHHVDRTLPPSKSVRLSHSTLHSPSFPSTGSRSTWLPSTSVTRLTAVLCMCVCCGLVMLLTRDFSMPSVENSPSAGQVAMELTLRPEQHASAAVREALSNTGTSEVRSVGMPSPILSLHWLSQTDWPASLAPEMLAEFQRSSIEIPHIETSWISNFAAEMQPLRASMHSTLNILRRSLPLSSRTHAVDG